MAANGINSKDVQTIRDIIVGNLRATQLRPNLGATATWIKGHCFIFTLFQGNSNYVLKKQITPIVYTCAST